MTRIEKASEEKWKEIAGQSRHCREELMKLIDMVGPHVPKNVTEQVVSALNRLDQFRSDAEEEMFRRGGPQDIRIFYPGRKE